MDKDLPEHGLRRGPGDLRAVLDRNDNPDRAR